MIHKKTFLADPEWREILTKALKGSPWGCRQLEDVVVKILAASKGEKDGKAWLLVIQLVDGSKPVIAIKHREGEIPADERARVPGNNLAFFQNIGSGYGGVYDEHLGGFGWLSYDGELARLGVKRDITRRIWDQLLAKVCNRRGLECQKPAVLAIGGLWFCEEHSPKAAAKQREAILANLLSEADAMEALAARNAVQEDAEERATQTQALLHMAIALRARHRVLSRRRCWKVLTPPEEAVHAG